MDARYGPEDPRPESVAAAETAADQALRERQGEVESAAWSPEIRNRFRDAYAAGGWA